MTNTVFQALIAEIRANCPALYGSSACLITASVRSFAIRSAAVITRAIVSAFFAGLVFFASSFRLALILPHRGKLVFEPVRTVAFPPAVLALHDAGHAELGRRRRIVVFGPVDRAASGQQQRHYQRSEDT